MTDAKACGKSIRPAALVVVALAWLLAPGRPAAADGPDWPAAGEPVAVAEAVDAITLRLADGRLLRLAGLRRPLPPIGAEGAAAAPFAAWAEQGRSRLSALAAGREMTVHPAVPAVDRYGRQLGHAVRPDGLWLQQALVSAGLAMVMPHREADPALARALLAAEAAARRAGRGLWAEAALRVRTADDAGAAVSAFRIVEGTVANVAAVRGRVYLNFGEDWREDFTVSIAPGDRDGFEEAGIDPMALEGTQVRVRGWLRDFNGPLIDAIHPAQIELLEAVE
jgi:endonuclease YncB( thermonuclease family)